MPPTAALVAVDGTWTMVMLLPRAADIASRSVACMLARDDIPPEFMAIAVCIRANVAPLLGELVNWPWQKAQFDA